MSRYSRMFLRSKDTLSLSGEYTPKTNEPAYSRPHPYRYQLAALHSPEGNNFEVNRAAVAPIPRDTLAVISNHDNEKLLIGAQAAQPQTLPQRARKRPVPFYLRPVAILLTFLPIPPLLSLLYMTVGHIILRQDQKPSASIYSVPILSSIEAGATGGVILSLPIALLLYLLVFPSKQPSVPEDFFDDGDSVTTGPARWFLYTGYVVCAFLLVGIGGIAGPLGVTCLSSIISDEFLVVKKMLSTGAAAAAGFVGGVVLSVGILLLAALTTLVWLFWVRQNIPFP